jgi:hypothetical protein
MNSMTGRQSYRIKRKGHPQDTPGKKNPGQNRGRGNLRRLESFSVLAAARHPDKTDQAGSE